MTVNLQPTETMHITVKRNNDIVFQRTKEQPEEKLPELIAFLMGQRFGTDYKVEVQTPAGQKFVHDIDASFDVSAFVLKVEGVAQRKRVRQKAPANTTSTS